MISRIACFILAAHLFNLSIDPRDPGPAFAPDNLAQNDIETIAEFMAEVVLGISNAFAEHEESDDHGQTIHWLQYVSPPPVTCIQSVSVPDRASVFCNLNIGITQSPLTKITAPPPRLLV